MIKEATEVQIIVGKLFKEVTGHEYNKGTDREMLGGLVGMMQKGGKLSIRERLTASLGMLLITIDSDRLTMMVWEFLPEEERDKPIGGSAPEASKKEEE